MSHRLINKRLRSLWRSTKHNGYAPVQYAQSHQHGIVFVSCNPSLPNANKLKFLKNHGFAPKDYRKYVKWIDTAQHWKRLLQIEGLTTKNYEFFKPMSDIAQDLRLDWTNVDLFALRHTRQNETLKQFTSKRKFTSFAELQLNIAKDFIVALRPRVILVCNAKASRIFAELFGVDAEADFNDKKGYHIAQIGNKPTPVLFSSMLSGQRALDVFSLQRLKWAAARAVKLGC